MSHRTGHDAEKKILYVQRPEPRPPACSQSLCRLLHGNIWNMVICSFRIEHKRKYIKLSRSRSNCTDRELLHPSTRVRFAYTRVFQYSGAHFVAPPPLTVISSPSPEHVSKPAVIFSQPVCTLFTYRGCQHLRPCGVEWLKIIKLCLRSDVNASYRQINGICHLPGGTAENHWKLNQSSQFSCWDWKQVPPRYSSITA
jgi:hypothetical protein